MYKFKGSLATCAVLMKRFLSPTEAFTVYYYVVAHIAQLQLCYTQMGCLSLYLRTIICSAVQRR